MARRAGPLGTCDGSTEAVCSVVAVPFMSKPYQGISREPRARYPRMTCRQKGHTVLLPVGPDGKKAQMPRLPRRVVDAHRMHSCGQANEAASAGSWHALMAGGVAGRLEVNASLGLSSAEASRGRASSVESSSMRPDLSLGGRLSSGSSWIDAFRSHARRLRSVFFGT